MYGFIPQLSPPEAEADSSADSELGMLSEHNMEIFLRQVDLRALLRDIWIHRNLHELVAIMGVVPAEETMEVVPAPQAQSMQKRKYTSSSGFNTDISAADQGSAAKRHRPDLSREEIQARAARAGASGG